MRVTGSIVLYKNDPKAVLKAVDSLLASDIDLYLYIIDNSPVDEISKVITHNRINYISNHANLGFGAGHNIAINYAIETGSKYHLIVNPDIYFDTDVVTPMIKYMQEHLDTGMLMPEILYPDGRIQYLPKLLPNPYWIVRRKLKLSSNAFNNFIDKYELRKFPRAKIYNAPILSGCFTLLSIDAIKEVGCYDEKFFMYFEDFDLSRRMHEKYKTMYFPMVSVYHGYEGGANKSFKLFKVFLLSAIYYFTKWGWFFDKERKNINQRALSHL